MTFAHTLERLRGVLDPRRQRSEVLGGGRVAVAGRDLEDLLYHFDRVDRHLRSEHEHCEYLKRENAALRNHLVVASGAMITVSPMAIVLPAPSS